MPDLRLSETTIAGAPAVKAKCACVRADPVGQSLREGCFGVGQARCAEGGDEQLAGMHLTGRRIDDVDRRAGVIDEQLLAATCGCRIVGDKRPSQADRVRRTSCGRNRPDVRAISPRPVAASHPCGATRGGSRAQSGSEPPSWPWSSGPDRGASPVRRRQDRPAAANRRRLRAPGAGTLQRRSGQSRDWRQSGAWTGRRPTAAAPRGSCAWVILLGHPHSSRKRSEVRLIRDHPTAFITPVHSPVALVAIDRNRWSSSTGNGGRLQPETPVAMARSAHYIDPSRYRSIACREPAWRSAAATQQIRIGIGADATPLEEVGLKFRQSDFFMAWFTGRRHATTSPRKPLSSHR